MLTAVVLTKNSSATLTACLESLKFCDKLVVVDGKSEDDTLKIAKKFSAQILIRDLQGDYSAQRNFALSQVKSQWVLFVDSDEVVSPALATEIIEAVSRVEYKGYFIKRVDYLWGHPLKHGDVGNVHLLRLARHGAGEWSGKVHEIWNIEGRTGSLKNELSHYPHSTVVDFVSSIDAYSTIRAGELFFERRHSNVLEIIFWPIAKFTNLYLFKLGLLDGTPGFIHAMIMAFYSFLVRGKLYLLWKGIPSTHA